MKNYFFILALLFLALDAVCSSEFPPDSIQSIPKVVIGVNLDNNKVREVKYYNDTILLCSQRYISGKLSHIVVNDNRGLILEEYSLYQNGRVSNAKKFIKGLLEEEIIYSKGGKIEIIFYYNNGILSDYVKFDRDGQPKSKLKK